MNILSQKVEKVEKNIPRSKGGTRKNQKKKTKTKTKQTITLILLFFHDLPEILCRNTRALLDTT